MLDLFSSYAKYVQLPKIHKLRLCFGRITGNVFEGWGTLRVFSRNHQYLSIKQFILTVQYQSVDCAFAAPFSAIYNVYITAKHPRPLLGLNKVLF